MTKQEYRQKVEEILQKVHDDAVRPTHLKELGYSDRAVDELVSLYEETPGFPATGKNKAIPGNGGVSKPDQRFSDFKEFLADNCYDLKKFKEGKYDRKIFKWFQPDLTETVREVVESEGFKKTHEEEIEKSFGRPDQNVGGVTNKVTKKHNRPIEPVIRPDSPEGLIEEILRACFDSEYNGFNFARAKRELSTLIKNLAYLSITRKKKAFRERFTEEGSFKVYGTPNEVFDFFLEDYDEKVQQ